MASDWVKGLVVGVLGATMATTAAGAADDDFYKGNTVTLIISSGPGGGYSQVGHILTRHMPRYIPGEPRMIVQYQEKAGGLQAANYLYNAAPADGSYMGLLRNSTTFGQQMKLSGVKYEAEKFQWIGSVEPVVNVLAARTDSGVKTLADLKQKELVVGAAGKLDTLYIFPTVMAKMLGYKLKVVSGYKGTADVVVALERSEVTGLVQPFDNWLTSPFHRSKSVSYLTQFSYARTKDLPEVATMVELGRNAEETAMLKLVSVPAVLGRNIAAPPKAPKERVATLRTAFDATMKDAGFIAEMKKAGRSVEPLNGAAVEKVIAETLSTPPALVERVRQYLGY